MLRAVRPAPMRAGARRSAVRRAPTVRVQAIFGNIFRSPSPSPNSQKAAELKEELTQLVSTSRAPAADVEQLVNDLQPLSIKAPVRSKQLFGEYKLIYSSKPGVASRQILEEPDVIREITESKTLLLTSTNTLSGTLDGVDNNTYEESFDRLETKGPLNTDSREVDVLRQVEVLYLDQELRITRTVQKEGDAGVLAIYQRVLAEQDDDDEDDAAPKKQGTGFSFLGGAPKEGTATIAEREVRKKMQAEEARKTPRLPVTLPGTTKVGTQSTKVGTQSSNAAAEARRKEAEAAKERAAAIKSQIEELTADYKEAQAEAREQAKEAKDLERANGAVLKKVAGARQQLRAAAEEVEDVISDIARAQEQRAAAEAALKQALSELNAAQSELKQLSLRK